MRAETWFLKELEKKLKYLSLKDREDFISNYRLQIYDRHKSGEQIIDIINSFESPSLIAENIYTELNIDTKSAKAKSYKALGITKIILAIFSIIPQIIVFIFFIASLLTAAILTLSILFCVTMFWVNYDPLQAIGGTLLSLGLLPLLAILFTFIGVKIYKFEKMFLKVSIELITGREQEVYSKKENSKKSIKLISIIFLTVFSIFTVSGLIGSFAGNNTIGGSTISKIMPNSEETWLTYEENSEKVQAFSYYDLYSYSWYPIKLVKNEELNGKFKLERKYNFKKSIKFNYSINSKNELYVSDVPLNLKIFTVSSSIFTITYNPNEVNWSLT